jgi:hypothetical protein
MKIIVELFIINSPMVFVQTVPFTTRSFLESQITLLTPEIYYSPIH